RLWQTHARGFSAVPYARRDRTPAPPPPPPPLPPPPTRSRAVHVRTLVPLAAASVLASSLFKQASSLWFNPEVGQQLDRGVAVYKDYVKAIKDDMRHQTDAIAADEVLREAARKKNVELVEAQLNAL